MTDLSPVIAEDGARCEYAMNESRPPGPTTASVSQHPPQLLLPSMYQVLIILLGSVPFLTMGMVLSWPNTLTSHLRVNNTTLTGHQLHLSYQQLDWTGSVLYIVGCASILPAGWLVGRKGRRIIFIMTAVPFTAGWLLFALAYNFQMILVGRCLMGVAMVMLNNTGRAYMAEIANTNIRGMVSSFMDIMKGLGYVVVGALGVALPWYHIAFVNICLVLIYCTAFVFLLPESPSFLAIQGREEEALCVLRRLRPPSEDVSEEIMQIKLINDRKDKSSGFAALIKRDIIKKEAALLGLTLIYSFVGVEVMKVNLSRMMLSANINLDANYSSTMVMSVLLCGSVVMTAVVDRLGRKGCLIISLLLMSVAYTVLGTITYLTPPPTLLELQLLTPPSNDPQFAYENITSTPASPVLMWVSLACFIILAFSINFGIGSVIFILPAEYFPTNIRPQAASVFIMALTLLSFMSIRLYSVMVQGLTQAGLFWFYGAVSVLGAIYVYTVIHETMQQSIG